MRRASPRGPRCGPALRRPSPRRRRAAPGPGDRRPRGGAGGRGPGTPVGSRRRWLAPLPRARTPMGTRRGTRLGRRAWRRGPRRRWGRAAPWAVRARTSRAGCPGGTMPGTARCRAGSRSWPPTGTGASHLGRRPGGGRSGPPARPPRVRRSGDPVARRRWPTARRAARVPPSLRSRTGRAGRRRGRPAPRPGPRCRRRRWWREGGRSRGRAGRRGRCATSRRSACRSRRRGTSCRGSAPHPGAATACGCRRRSCRGRRSA